MGCPLTSIRVHPHVSHGMHMNLYEYVMSLMLALGRQNEGNLCDFKASLIYIVKYQGNQDYCERQNKYTNKFLWKNEDLS